MSSENGHGKIEVDLNRVTRREFRVFRDKVKALNPDDPDEKEKLREEREQVMAEFYEKVISAWPFDVPVSAESYLNLGMIDSNAVDIAFNEAMEQLGKKN